MRYTILTLALLSTVIARSAVVGKAVDYSANGVTMKGYLAYDDTVTKKVPGILVVHEWWGTNEYSHRRAEMLAKLGYVALAVDMYGDGKQAEHPDDAGKFSSEVMKNLPVMEARFNAAEDLLKKDKHVDTSRIGAIGYCFGGGVVLNMARAGADLQAIVSFPGSLASSITPKKGDVKAKVLVCHGGADKFSSADDIKKFKKDMTSAGAEFKFIVYPGAMHAFTNPAATELGKKFNIPIAYNKKADEKSWNDMKKFFAEVFKK